MVKNNTWADEKIRPFIIVGSVCMQQERLEKQFAFALEIDKEKRIGRQTYCTDGDTLENDAEHAWHAALMAILFSEYANEPVDVLKVVKMLLIHDIVEIDAGDTYAYDEAGLSTQAEREMKAAERIYHILPADQAQELMALWQEFEALETPEAKYAKAMDNLQPAMLNAATNGRAWKEHEVKLSKILKRNQTTAEGAGVLWQYGLERFVKPHVELGNIQDDVSIEN